jgi:hypothetical protein
MDQTEAIKILHEDLKGIHREIKWITFWIKLSVLFVIGSATLMGLVLFGISRLA